jgi:DNA-binding PadR family transcriptional regulator
MKLSKKQESYLLTFVFNPHFSAYDIERKKKPKVERGDDAINSSEYRQAKNIVSKLCELKLIELGNEKERNPRNRKSYSLTDNGLFYIIRLYTLFGSDIQAMIKNYPNFKMFKDLVYPFIKLDTLRSENIPIDILHAISLYIQKHCAKIEKFVHYSKNKVKWDEYGWNWDEDKLRAYLIDNYLSKYKWLENSGTKEYFDPPSLKFFNKNKSIRQYIYIKLRLKGDKIYGYLIGKRKGTKIKEIIIPKIETFLINFHQLSKKEAIGRSFSNYYSSESSKFVFLLLSAFTGYTSQTSELFSKDENFIRALEAAKEEFNNFYLAIKNPSHYSLEALIEKDLRELAYKRYKNEMLSR